MRSPTHGPLPAQQRGSSATPPCVKRARSRSHRFATASKPPLTPGLKLANSRAGSLCRQCHLRAIPEGRDRERLQRLRHLGDAGRRGRGAAGQRRGGGDLRADGGRRGARHRRCGRRLHDGAAQRARRPHGRALGGSARQPADAPPAARPGRSTSPGRSWTSGPVWSTSCKRDGCR
jgi:hypothetical protein